MGTLKSKGSVPYPKSRKLLYNLILICIPVLLLILLEFFLRVIDYGCNYSLFLDFPDKSLSEYRYINPKIGKKYFQKLDYTTPGGDMFCKEKPENGFRLFVMGSSTAMGFPYYHNAMFSRILQERLQDSYPGKKIEIVNTAITAVNSFTLLDFINDVLDEDPDAILIYAGHNEFYGAFGIGSVEKSNRSRNLIILHEKLLNFRMYQFLRDGINRIMLFFSGRKTDEDVLGTFMKVIVDDKEIIYQDKTYSIGIESYRKNMDQLLRKVKRKNVPVFISELVSNVKNQKPLCSKKSTRFPASSDVYYSGLKYEREGNYDQAKEYLYLAKDLDCLRFRASEEINAIIHELAIEYDAFLIPMKSIFEDSSPNGLIGYNLITEHLHPNIEGYFLMADAFYEVITGSNVIGEPLNPFHYNKSSYYRVNWGFTELDSLYAMHKVNILMSYWPFQSHEATADTYKKTYRPRSLVDSIAFQVATSPVLNISEAHVKLAAAYKNKGDYFNAFREYYAAIKCDPFQVSYYNKAIDCLTHTNDLPLALKLIEKSLELKQTYYANGIKSEILFLKGDYAEAEKALIKASEIDSNKLAKVQILSNLFKIYYVSGDMARSQETLRELRKINPGYQPEIPPQKKYVNYIPVQVEGMVNKAIELCKAGNLDAALEGFLKSLEIKETALANRFVGDILYSKGDSSAISYYMKAYPEYKEDVNFLYNLGILYLNGRMKKEVQVILDEIRKIDPDNKSASYLEEFIGE
ncbi:MAG: hypothetical protein JW973_04030 [Bacteroidales bacterium]|nr:hypothetical protein [Bacteroidales bacterium]